MTNQKLNISYKKVPSHLILRFRGNLEFNILFLYVFLIFNI